MINSRAIEMTLAAIAAIVLPAGSFVLLALSTILVDSVFGLLSMKIRGEVFDFKKLVFKGILVKLLVYSAIILLLYWVDTLLIDSVIDKQHLITKIGTLFILTNELRSIWKHFCLLTGTDSAKSFSFLNGLIEGARKLIDKAKK